MYGHNKVRGSGHVLVGCQPMIKSKTQVCISDNRLIPPSPALPGLHLGFSPRLHYNNLRVSGWRRANLGCNGTPKLDDPFSSFETLISLSGPGRRQCRGV